MFEDWVIDAGMSRDGVLCFIPVEGIETATPSFMISMNVISDIEHFDQGRVRGIIHPDGQDAVEAWCRANPEIIAAMEKRRDDAS